MEKDLLVSKTFIGAVITVLAPLLSEVGIDLGDQASLIEAITGLFGFAMVIFGRFKADKKITKVAGMPVE